ncbi:transcriptional regulator [Niabella ginsenosidivorans]|uniref:Transcriptional regulator n=2 Tax=Niabella ginsenosidivorans TaxID=1176587 RepID=A0A1A9IB00_9BACT|nr:transcriptional regulator [Niabella ginsenosidivorans]
MQKKIHQGHNIKRFREMLGIKQDALAADLGDDWNQQKISLLEQKETIDAPLLQQVAEALKLPVEAIKNFDEEQAIQFISNTINNNDNAVMHGPSLYSYCPTFNPIEKWLEALEENKKLYERMIKEKDDMIYTLQAMLENMKK